MVLVYRIHEGLPVVLPKRIISEGKTYNFKAPLPDDETFQDRWFDLWQKASKNNAKAKLFADGK